MYYQFETGFLDPRRLRLQTRIGRGGAGQVWKGLMDGQRVVAVKQLFDSKKDQVTVEYVGKKLLGCILMPV